MPATALKQPLYDVIRLEKYEGTNDGFDQYVAIYDYPTVF